MPYNNNWPLIVVVCFLIAFVLNQVLPSLSSSRRGSWLLSITRRLDPVIVVACLFACLGAYGSHISPATGYLALLAFIISSPLFGSLDLPSSGPGGRTPLSRLPATCWRVVGRWGAIVAGLLFLGFAFDVGVLFPRRVMLTWFVITPIALCMLQALRLRAR